MRQVASGEATQKSWDALFCFPLHHISPTRYYVPVDDILYHQPVSTQHSEPTGKIPVHVLAHTSARKVLINTISIIYYYMYGAEPYRVVTICHISRRSICPRSRRTSLPGAFTRSIYLFTPEYKYLLEYQVFIFRSSLLLSSSTRIVYLLITSNWW